MINYLIYFINFIYDLVYDNETWKCMIVYYIIEGVGWPKKKGVELLVMEWKGRHCASRHGRN